MRSLREWRVLATALLLAVISASPASTAAHARAHHQEALEAHRHGTPELAAPDHHAGHQHAALDQAVRRTIDQNGIGPAVSVATIEFAIAPSLIVSETLRSFLQTHDPPGRAPPRVRAPPVR